MGSGLRASGCGPRAIGALVFASLVPSLAAAQSTDGPPGPYAIDVRAAIGSLPQDASFFPSLPTGTPIPVGSLGFDVGAHVYVFQIGPARLGLGANLLRVGGEASPSTPSGSAASPPAPPRIPRVETRVRMFAPQLSFNFGSSQGWSYLSAGIGEIRVRTATSEFATGSDRSAPLTPARTRETAALQTINFGGGARWFNTAHLAFSFDVRFHKAASRDKGGVSTVPVTLITASAGLSLK